MGRYEWSNLNKLQVGKFAEYYVKMEFTMLGFDVYASEVDDKGIDFVIRKNSPNGDGKEINKYYDIQVKSVREIPNYTYMEKGKFNVDDKNLLLTLVVFYEGVEPKLYLIPSKRWRTPDSLLVDHEFIDKKSKPEWGINLSKKNLPFLEEYNFNKRVVEL